MSGQPYETYETVMEDKKRENAITEKCRIFRGIIRKNRILLCGQVLAGLLEVYFLFGGMFATRYGIMFILPLILLAKLCITIFMRNSKGNIIGLCAYPFIIGLTVYFNLTLETLAVPFYVISILIHIMRIENYTAFNRII